MKVSVIEVGSCQHPSKVVIPQDKKAGWSNLTFPATVILMEHPTEGLILYDTGYAPRMFEACSKFPESLYLKVTPVSLPKEKTLLYQLDQKGISADDIRYVVISHFHADHIGGLKDFRKAKFIFLKSAISHLQEMGRVKALTNAYLPALVPKDIMERAIFLEDKPQKSTPFENSQFSEGWDFFNDESLFLVELPGHARGQVGAFIQSDSGKRYFCVADACWTGKSYINNWAPSKITGLIHYNFKDYKDTLRRIHNFSKEQEEILVVPCHCSQAVTEMKQIEANHVRD